MLDANEIQTVQGMFAGGEALNLHLHSNAVTIGDEENTIDINVRSIQSLCSGYSVEHPAMEALIQLFNSRDLSICDAYKEVNEKKIGYMPRVRSLYLSAKISTVLFNSNDVPLDELLQNPIVAGIISSRSLVSHYRTVIPFLWSLHQQWIVVILDSITKRILILYPRYDQSIRCRSTSDSRVALNSVIKEVLSKIIQLSDTANYVETDWIFQYSDPEDINDKIQLVGESLTTVFHANDSGIFVLYAMETDYFNAPFYAPEKIDWDNFRIRLAYCLLSKQLYN